LLRPTRFGSEEHCNLVCQHVPARPGFCSHLFWGFLGALVGGAVALFVIFSNILDEEMSDFRVALLPRTAVADTLGAPASSPAANYQK
jgi:hypothetical protein